MSKETKKAGALLTEKENARAAIIAKATKIIIAVSLTYNST